MLDFNTAAPAQERTLIPAKTVAPVRVSVIAGDPGTQDGAVHITQTGLHQLSLEFTITDGPFARRKVRGRYTIGSADGAELSDGQSKAIAISATFLRSLIEAARGVASTDESPRAIEARRVRSLLDFDGLEVSVEIGVEQDRRDGMDRNKIARILPAEGATSRTASPAQATAATRSAPPAAKTKASWG